MSFVFSSAEKWELMNSRISLSSGPKTETLFAPRRCSPSAWPSASPSGMPAEGEGEGEAGG